MVVGSLARQRRGAWLTTTANLWGSLALDKFAAKFESQKLAGVTVATIEAASPAAASPPARVADWNARPEGGKATLPWPPGSGTLLAKASPASETSRASRSRPRRPSP